ncbi:WD40 repeat-like protein [Mycena sanguinolenta]|uniref:WD40 repeat-like protein n=1 Tax=Mycena sanguinolenta TaxID=230812 RepID=A0A8H6Y0P4_9AGAR|nr:WD40 repeat-like protein [Mycena sanguinolenta]
MPSKFADSSAEPIPAHSSDAPQATGLGETDSSSLSPVQGQTVALSNLPTNPSHPLLNDDQEHPSYPSESPNTTSQSPPPGQTTPPDPSSLPQETPLPSSAVPRTAKGCPCSKSGRRLIVAFDGTENQFGPRSSHVVEFYSRIVKNDDQPSYYTSGIGTYTKRTGVLKNAWVSVKNKWASITGSNFKSNLLAGYQWLSENYKQGDRIFLLGFSRGAYQARVLAAMITKVGLIRTGNKEQIPLGLAGIQSLRWEFFAIDIILEHNQPSISVSSVMLSLSTKDESNSSLNMLLFQTWIGLNVTTMENHGVRKSGSEDAIQIGGGRRMNLTCDNGGVPSRWMAYEAMLAGLEMTPFRRTFVHQDFTGNIPTTSMTLFYNFFEYAPLGIAWAKDHNALSGTRKLTYSPHRARARQIYDHQKLHFSVALLGYQAPATLAALPWRWGTWNSIWGLDNLTVGIQNVLTPVVSAPAPDPGPDPDPILDPDPGARILARTGLVVAIQPTDLAPQANANVTQQSQVPRGGRIAIQVGIKWARQAHVSRNVCVYSTDFSAEGRHQLNNSSSFKEMLLEVLQPERGWEQETEDILFKRIELGLRLASKLFHFDFDDHQELWDAVWRLLTIKDICPPSSDFALVVIIRTTLRIIKDPSLTTNTDAARTKLKDFLMRLPDRRDEYLSSLKLGRTADTAKVEVITELIAADEILPDSQCDSSLAIHPAADDMNRENIVMFEFLLERLYFALEKLEMIPERVLSVLSERLNTAQRSPFGDCFADRKNLNLVRRILLVVLENKITDDSPASDFLSVMMTDGILSRIPLDPGIFDLLIDSESNAKQRFLLAMIQRQPALVQDYCLHSTRFTPVAERIMTALQGTPGDMYLLKILVPLTPHLHDQQKAQAQTEKLCKHLIRSLGGDSDPLPRRTAALCLVILFESDTSGQVARLLRLDQQKLETEFQRLGYQTVWEAVWPRISETSPSTPTTTARQQVCNALHRIPKNETWAVDWALELIPALPVEGITDERRVHHEDGGMSDAPVGDLEGEQHERNREGGSKGQAHELSDD